jgi:hypothetical protein
MENMNTELLNELLEMRAIGIKVSDNTLNHARTEDLFDYENMDIGELASLFCDLYNL